MSTPLSTLVQPMTVAEASDTLYAAIATRGIDTTTWKAGDPVRTIVAGLAIIVAALTKLISLVAKMGFLALSESDWLTLVASYVYGVTRGAGSYASGTVRLTNAGGGVFVQGAYTITVSNGSKTYRNTQGFTLGGLTFVDVPFAADEIGTASTASVGTITTMTTPLTGVSASNTTAFVGTDAESDASLRERCAEKLGALSPDGPKDAYAYAARNALKSDGTSAGVTRIRTIPDGIGGVDVYLASATATIAGSVGDLSTALGAADAAMDELAAPLAITLRTHGAGTVAISVVCELWVSSTNTKSDATINADVTAALNAFISSRVIGGDVIAPSSGKVYVSALEGVIAAAIPMKDAAGAPIPGTGAVRIDMIDAADVSIGTTAAPVPGSYTIASIHRVTGAMV